MRYRTLALWFLAAAAVSALPSTAMARIKLITLPVRERVEIQLDNPNATLVEEERIVPLVRGVNQVDFSWANTQIDPNTIVFRVIAGTDGAAAKAAAKARRSRRPRNQAPGRESPLGQLSAQRGGPGLAGLLQRLGLRPRADQLSAGEPHQELQLPGGGRARREDAGALRVHAHPEPGQRVVRLDGAVGRFRPPLPEADRPERDQGDARGEVHRGAGQEDLHLRPAGPRLPRPPAEQAPGADALRAQEQQGQPPGRGAVAVRQGPHLPGRRPRRNGLHRRGLGQVHPAGRRDAALRRRGPGRGRQAHHRQERAAPHRRQPLRPRSGRQVRDRELQGQGRHAGHLGERAGDPQRVVWRQRAGTCSGNWARTRHSPRGRTKRRAPSTSCSSTSALPARGADAKAEKIVHKLHLPIKNEW